MDNDWQTIMEQRAKAMVKTIEEAILKGAAGDIDMYLFHLARIEQDRSTADFRNLRPREEDISSLWIDIGGEG